MGVNYFFLFRFNSLLYAVIITLFSVLMAYSQQATITGELKQYHKLTLTWSAENLSEETTTYKDYRLDVTFTSPTGKTYVVPGYFAADGNAAETGATSGDKWRCHFNPLEIGVWTFVVSYRSGTNIAASIDINSGNPIPLSIHADSGSFTIAATDKVGKDLRGKGRLEYVGEHFLRWTNGEYFLKIGNDSPDNFLEYNDFDNTTYHKNGDRFYPDHIVDWQNDDPNWKGNLGKGLIGVVNYLSEQGVNAQYILTDNTYGDADSVFPWTDKDSHFSYDNSKLDQWQIVFDHLIKKGLMVHFVLSESEQQSLFELAADAQGDVDFADARKIYFRELMARFGYLNAITWNIGEENGWNRNTTYGRKLTSEQQINFANYIDSLAYYNDHISLHNGPANTDNVYTALLGNNALTGAGTQGFLNSTDRSINSTIKWRTQSEAAGKKWVVTYDEAYSGSTLDELSVRSNLLWATLMAGGAGIELYLPGRDLVEQNFRTYQNYWQSMLYAHSFFTENAIPFWQMESKDDIVNITNGWCLGDDENTYVIYIKEGGTTNLDLVGDYMVKWYNPRTGGGLIDGSLITLNGGTQVNIGNAPSDLTEDWVVFLQNIDNLPIPVTGITTYLDTATLEIGNTTTLQTTIVPANADNISVNWTSSDTAVVSVDNNGFVTALDSGSAIITVTTVDGNFTDDVSITVTEPEVIVEDPDETPVSFSQNFPNFNDNVDISAGTSLMFGPDGRLYVAEYTGEIKIYDIERTNLGEYIILDVEVLTDIQDIQDHNDDGMPYTITNRETLGLTVTGTSDNPVIYVTSSDFRIGGGSGGQGDIGLDTNSGIITRFTWNGTSWDVVDIVRGLPRSEENHATNGLEFVTINGTDFLIVAQGGHTNGGSPSTNFAYTTEYALSAAILSVNLTMINQMPENTENGRKYIYDLPTLDDPTRPNLNGIDDPNDPSYTGVDINDPFGGNDGLNQAIVDSNGPVQIYSPGYRNAYDLVVTENGALYVTDNGPNGGWGGFPENEGDPTLVTNNYVVGEPGSSSSSNGEQIVNDDHLIKVTNNIQTYLSGSFYGGHPNPVRANPEGAGLYVAVNETSTDGALFLTDVYEDGYTDGSILGLPPNWPPVPIAFANPVEADYRGPGINNPDGANDALITIWGTNTNGIDEYTATNFGGAMKGDLISGVNTGVLRRVQLDANGDLAKLTSSFASGLGGNALGITCNSDDDPFPGTIWVVTLNGKLIVLEPQDFLECVEASDPTFDPLADYDGDGYTNQDELENGTDTCNGASQPDDFDKVGGGILISNLNDLDDDNDGILDSEDVFQLGNPSESGSDAFDLPVENELFSSNAILKGYAGLGFTGLMNNGDDNPNWMNWLDRRDDVNDPNPNDVLGGAIGAMTMQMTSGTALAETNTQEKGFQYGVKIDSTSTNVTVQGSLVNFYQPLQLYGSNAPDNGELGIFIGDGTQSNYIKFVISQTGLSVLQEINDIPQTPINVDILEANRPTASAMFNFIIETSTGNISLEYSFDGESPVTMGTVIAQGSILEAIQNPNNDLAVGLIGSSNTVGVELEGTWGLLNVFDENGLETLDTPIVRINAAGSAISTSDGTKDWEANNTVGAQTELSFTVNTGKIYDDNVTPTRHASIPDYIDDNTYNTIFDQERYDASSAPEMQYTIPLEDGNYVVNIYTSNVYYKYPNIGDRIFDIIIEENIAFDDFDVIAAFGHQVGGMISYSTSVTDGNLNIEFIHENQNPIINAIEILGVNTGSNPILVADIPNQSDAVGTQLDASLSIAASGGDGNLTFTAENFPPGVVLEPTNGTIGGTILEEALENSPYLVTIFVDDSDGESSDQVVKTFNWTITEFVDLENSIPVVRINAAGPLVPAINDTIDWEANENAGEQIGSNYSVNTGLNYDDNAAVSRHSSIPDYIDDDTFTTIFNQERYDAGQAPEMEYTIPLENGSYVVNIYTSNVYYKYDEIGDRIFDIAIEGVVAFDDFDVIASFGHRVGGVLSHNVNVTDGNLNIEFIHEVQNPIVNAIEVLSLEALTNTVIVSSIADQNNTIGDNIELDIISAFGGDENFPLVYEISGQPIGIDIDSQTGIISGTIQEAAATGGSNQDGIYNIQITVSRGDATPGIQNFLWTIQTPTETDNFVPLVRINTGGPLIPVPDDGLDWEANNGTGEQNTTFYSVNTGFNYDDSATLSRHSSIPEYINETVFNAIFDQEKYDVGDEPEMQYSIPIAEGTYTVNIYTGNVYYKYPNIGDRLFNISLEGEIVETNIDVIEKFGHKVGGIISYTTTVTDGELNIEFLHVAGKNNPIVNGIEILSMVDQPSNVIISSIPKQNSQVGEVVELTSINASGGDESQPFVYQISGQPDGLLIDSNTGVISGTISENAQTGGINGDGFHNVQVIASRGDAIPGTLDFTWRIGTHFWNDKDEALNYTGRHECSFVQAGDNFYLLGGRENSKTVDVYNYTTNTWENLVNSAPFDFNHYQATEYKGLIWIIGSFGDNNFPNEIPVEYIWTFDPSNNEWIQGPEIPSSRRRGSSGLVVYNDKFYIVAGNTIGHNGGYVSWFDEYDPATGQWTILEDAPRARDHFHAAVIENKLYVAGGRLSGGAGGTFAPTIAEVDVYDFTTGSWSTLAENIPTPRGGSSTVNFNEKLVVIGGEVQNQLVYGELRTDALEIVEEFDPISQTWSRLPDLLYKRHGTQAIVSGGGIYTLGGSYKIGGGNQQNMEYYGTDSATGVSSISSTLQVPETITFNAGESKIIDFELNSGNVGAIVHNIQIIGSSAYSITAGDLEEVLLLPNTQYQLTVNLSSEGEGENAVLRINYGAESYKDIELTSGTVYSGLVNPNDQYNVEGEIISLPIINTNEGTNTTYSALNLPVGLNIDSATGIISGTVQEDTANGVFVEENGLVVIEAENTVLEDDFILVTDADGTTGIQSTTNHFNDRNGGKLSYRVKINTTGVYRFIWNSAFTGSSSSDTNDSWLRFPNNDDVWFFGHQGEVTSEQQLIDNLVGAQEHTVFPKGSSRITPTTTPAGSGGDEFFKVYRFGGITGKYSWISKVNDENPFEIYIWFVNPGEYTFEISERSDGHKINRLAMFKVDGINYANAAALLNNSNQSQIVSGTGGASNNSPYNVQIDYMDDDTSELINFQWVIGDPGDPSEEGDSQSMTAKVNTESSLNSNYNIGDTQLITPILYPNPAKDYLAIKVPQGNTSITNVSVFNMSGKMVISQEVSLLDNDTFELYIKDLDQGIYLVNIYGNNYTILRTTKLVITK